MKNQRLKINIREILFLTGAVLAYRLLYVQFFVLFQSNHQVGTNFQFSNLLIDTLGNLPITLLMVIGDFLFVKLMNRHIRYGTTSALRFSFELIFLVIFSILISILISFTEIQTLGIKSLMNSGLLGLTFMSVLLVNTLILYVISIFFYYRNAHREALRFEREGKEKAMYHYTQLKRQLDPHFLFNSLNVLDNLVHTDPQKASSFIGKLAQIYRYLLSNEENDTVALADEVAFVSAYVNLMRERFDDGLLFYNEISPELHECRVIPCSIQTMVENAIKHNIVSPEKPLSITITADGEYVTTRNNLQLKQTPVVSHSVGLKNINSQCQTIIGREIIIDRNDNYFEVAIPIKR